MPTHIDTIMVGALFIVPLFGLTQCDSPGPEVMADDVTDVPSDMTSELADAIPNAIPDDMDLELLFDDDDIPTGERSGILQKGLEQLGKHVFFDEISVPQVIGCASCHDPGTGWTLRNDNVNRNQVGSPGAVPGAVGEIKAPSNAYMPNIPFEQTCGPFGLPCGGAFWDGRAEGRDEPLVPGATAHVGVEVFKGRSILKNLYGKFLGPLADQALQPFPNELEQNIGELQVCKHVAKRKYALLYALAWGEKIDCSTKGFMTSFKRIAVALAAWQSSSEVNSFSSKRDTALAAEIKKKGKEGVKFPLAGLTAQENLGHELFYGKANCATCHSNNPVFPPGDPNLSGLDRDEIYSDRAFHNIGVPANHQLPGPAGSPGFGGRSGLPDELGMHKTPTLRNVDKRPYKGFVKAYTHNGWFKSLESLVHFYNTSDVTGTTATVDFKVTRCDTTKPNWTEAEALAANCWPAPEETGTLATGFLLGDLHLTLEEEAAIVAYLKTLTDSKTVKPPKLLK